TAIMELLVLIGLLGWGLVSFLKGNTKRGAETVRAHVFLGGLAAGASVEEANHVAAYKVADGPTEVIASAMAHLKAEYGGSQRGMIADAYGKGMKPNLPFWYRQVIASRVHPPARPHGLSFEEY